MFFRLIYQQLAYYLTLFLFGACGLYLNLLALFASARRSTAGTQRFFQRAIHWHFALFHRWCEALRLVSVRYHGLEDLPPGSVVVANHPSLIDITCLLARIPEAVCIFKPGIRRNPILGAAARKAGYIASDGGHDVLRRAAEKVAAGQTLVIFPEGTRTPPGVAVQPFKPGFIVIARRAQAPLQLVRITTDSNVLAKGRAWWKPMQFPAHVHLTAGPRITVAATSDTADLAAEIEAWFRQPASLPATARERQQSANATCSTLTPEAS